MARREPEGSPPRIEAGDGDGLDVVVDGERIAAATDPTQAACVLRDLAAATASILEGRAPRAIVALCDAPWELCLAGAGAVVAVSVYRTGPLPEVRALDRPVGAAQLARQLRAAHSALAPRVDAALDGELASLLDRVAAAAESPAPPPARELPAVLRWRSHDEASPAPLRVAFEAVVTDVGAIDRGAVRADLYALLLRGRLTFALRGQQTALPAGYVFLQLERLVALCRPLLEAYAARRALHLRVAVGAAMVGLRLGTDGRLALSVSDGRGAALAAPALDPREFAAPLVDAALALARGAVQYDRARARNLRLQVLRAEARGLRGVLRDLAGVASKLNDDPAPYRASAAPAASDAEASHAGFDLTRAARLRYALRWRAEVEGIDLAGTLLCGDRLVVPGAREVAAFDRRTGVTLWHRPLPRAATTLAGGDILRLTPKGEVELRDVRDGEVLWSSRVAPRVGAPALAFVVGASGLPPAVVLAEGERRLVALDLRTGEARWRYTSRAGGAFRIRRVGRLLLVVGGDTSLTALDAATGEVVWRYVAAAPLGAAPAVRNDVVLAASGVGSRGASARLYAVDAFTGALRWTADHAAAAVSAPATATDVASVVLSGRDGVSVVGHDLATGEARFSIPIAGAVLQGRAVALTAFDQLLVANLPSGRVAAIDADRGTTRWTQTLVAPVADDTPRRLDVQMRAGALFVPQSTLAVLRPRDGAVLANAEACDLVPDLLRVDEECALYVAEESGHVACYELGARLSVVSLAN